MFQIKEQILQAKAAYRSGNYDRAITLCTRGHEQLPDNAELLVIRGDAFDMKGEFENALRDYTRAFSLAPVNVVDSRIQCLRFRKLAGAGPPPRQAGPGQPVIAASRLQALGRFGNQILQYAAIRTMASALGAEVATPDWIGRHLYDVDDPLLDRAYPPLTEERLDMASALAGRGPVNVDLQGYFQDKVPLLAGHRDAIRSWFRPSPRIRDRLDAAIADLRRRGETLVALHLRRGDFGYGQFWVADNDWYLAWLAEIWPGLRNPVLYIASDDPGSVAEDFASYRPVLFDDLGVTFEGAEYVIDHHILREADVLAISNSSFSFTAAMLNAGASALLRPDPDRRALVAFDPWASKVLITPADPSPRLNAGTVAMLRSITKGDQVFACLGPYGSPWATWIRRQYPTTVVHEASARHGLDRMLERDGLGRINVLFVEGAGGLDSALAGGTGAFGSRRIDALVFKEDGGTSPTTLSTLRGLGYLLFRIGPQSADIVSGPPARGDHVLMRAELARPNR